MINNANLVDVRVEAHPHRPKVLAGEANCLSIRPMVPGGRVMYGSLLVLRDCEFVSQPSGLARVEREGVRNVHAWVRGKAIVALEGDFPAVQPKVDFIKVTYNPFKRDHFYEIRLVTDDYGFQVAVPGRKVVGAASVVMQGGNCFAFDPVFES